MAPQSVRGYRFAKYSLDLARRRLVGPDAQPLHLSGRAFEVLGYLIAHRDRVVAKHELLDAVWPDADVEENSLTQAVSTLRRALGDSRGSPRFIMTFAGRGYQFVADVLEMQEIPDDAGTPPAPPPISRRRRIIAAVQLAGATLAAAVRSLRPRH